MHLVAYFPLQGVQLLCKKLNIDCRCSFPLVMPSASSPLPHQPSQASNHHYSSEAVQAILTHALEMQSAADYSPQQLQDMAAELHIDPDVLAQAEADWRSQREAAARRTQATATKRRRRRQQWLHYGVGSALMVGIDVATAGTITWSIFPVLGWGLGTLLGANSVGCHSSSGA